MIPAIMPSYGQPELAFERGEGLDLYTTDGRRFLDFGAGIAVTVVGHSHPHLVQALVGQDSKRKGQFTETWSSYLVDTDFADTELAGIEMDLAAA